MVDLVRNKLVTLRIQSLVFILGNNGVFRPGPYTNQNICRLEIMQKSFSRLLRQDFDVVFESLTNRTKLVHTLSGVTGTWNVLLDPAREIRAHSVFLASPPNILNS